MASYRRSLFKSHLLLTVLALVMALCGVFYLSGAVSAVNPPQNPQSSSVGVQGRISAPPPSTAATISFPKDGQVFTSLPINVTGICSGDVLVKLFKNNVFSGSTECKNGNFTITIDLFSGRNELIARVYDSLDQAGPDSNMVTVTFNDSRPGLGNRVGLTSNYAKRGANPKETLTWPLILSGGTGPYALSIDWGDSKAADLSTQSFPGSFDAHHIYDSPGVYNIIVKAADKDGNIAYLQLVGVANGPLSQDNTATSGQTKTVTKYVWWPAALIIPLIAVAFWLGQRHAIRALRQRLERGDRPF